MDTQSSILNLLSMRKEQAIQEMYTHYGGLCRQVAGRILTSPEDVEEVVNDTILAVWKNVPPEQPRSLRAYLMRIARNTAMMRLRGNLAAMRDVRRKVSLNELEYFIPAPENPHDILECRQLVQVIDTYVEQLLPMNRYLFVRRFYYLDGMDELTETTGLSVSAVSTRLTRMRNGLRKHLRDEGLWL